MTIKKQREIVVEYERIQLIRKKARTELRYCTDCGQHADFVIAERASQLFEISTDDLYQFVRQNNCHSNANGEICLTSLLATFNRRSIGPQDQLERGEKQ